MYILHIEELLGAINCVCLNLFARIKSLVSGVKTRVPGKKITFLEKLPLSENSYQYASSVEPVHFVLLVFLQDCKQLSFVKVKQPISTTFFHWNERAVIFGISLTYK
jgi:hypothetical protein